MFGKLQDHSTTQSWLGNSTHIWWTTLEMTCQRWSSSSQHYALSMGNRPAIMVLRGFISISSVLPVPLNLLSMVSLFRSACRPPVAYILGHSTIQTNEMFHCNHRIIGIVTHIFLLWMSTTTIWELRWKTWHENLTLFKIYHKKTMVLSTISVGSNALQITRVT